MFRKIVTEVWGYFKGMNSEKDGSVSIKRNMAWGIATLLVFIEGYAVLKVPHHTEREIDMYIRMCEFFAVLNLSFVTLALSITTIEKLKELAIAIRPGMMGGGTPERAPEKTPEPEKKPEIVVTNTTEIQQQ